VLSLLILRTKNSSSNSLSLTNSTMNFLLLVLEGREARLSVVRELLSRLIMVQVGYVHLVVGQRVLSHCLLLLVEEEEREGWSSAVE